MQPPARARLVHVLLLLAVTLAAFWPVLGNGFVDYDDDRYVVDNPQVHKGLTPSSLAWAFSTFHASNWHPLTWMSHMLDWQLWGARPFGHHLTSLVLHVLSTLVLFLVLESATGAPTRSAFAAALFGVHPLHVQSVAWVAERKDVLSTFLWILALWAYLGYARVPTRARYALVAALFALGLLAKPMLVTFPLSLLVLDFWPLRRFHLRSPGRIVGEKLPLLALSVASSVVTLLAQRQGRALGSLENFPLAERLANALVSYVLYLWKTVVPARLAFFYPHRGEDLPGVLVAACALVLVVASLVAVRERTRHPFVLAGWVWYLGILVPVIGLVQVGSQAMADRYTYVPLIGILWIAAWGASDLLRARALFRWTALGLVLALAAATNVEARRWRDSTALFERAIEVAPGNYTAHVNLGLVLERQGKLDEAIRHYTETIALRPDHAKAHGDLARVLAVRGRLEDAYAHAAEAVRLDPELADAHFQMGLILARQGRDQEAIPHYTNAVRLDPDDAQLHNNLANSLARTGRAEEALSHLEAAVRLKPDYGQARANLAAALFVAGRPRDAWNEVREARRLGVEPSAQLLDDLSAVMPEPR